MNHPYEQLAELVDGTLDEDDLARVHAHLETCASCRADLAQATTGREAARSLPQVAPPADLHGNVTVAAGGHGHGAPAWYRWAGVAAAAAVVVAIATALPNVGQKGKGRAAADSAISAQAGSETAQDAGGRGPVEVTDKDYDAKDLEQLARETGSEAAALGTVPRADATAGDAARCVRRAFAEQPAGRLARLIQARFEGRPAYIAVYLEGPGADQPADTAVVWVAAKDDCTVLSFASART
jgi:putative zinc finger protein